MDGNARHFRAAQTALAAEALAQAQGLLGSADAAAQKCGVPPLKSCPNHESTTSPPPSSPSTPAPPEAWQPRHASLTAVPQTSTAALDGQICGAGGLTTSTKVSAAIQIYNPTKDAWEPGPSLPEAVDDAMLATYQNRAKP